MCKYWKAPGQSPLQSPFPRLESVPRLGKDTSINLSKSILFSLVLSWISLFFLLVFLWLGFVAFLYINLTSFLVINWFCGVMFDGFFLCNSVKGCLK